MEPIPAETQPKPAFRFPLTAAGLTERGVSLITQDRVQEAVDQFTKAIALDPDYRPAWAKRAEAYLRLGLSQKAEEDQRRLGLLYPGGDVRGGVFRGGPFRSVRSVQLPAAIDAEIVTGGMVSLALGTNYPVFRENAGSLGSPPEEEQKDHGSHADQYRARNIQ